MPQELSFGEKLRRGRSHLLLIAVMLATSAVVINLEDERLGGSLSSSSDPQLVKASEMLARAAAQREPIAVILPEQDIARPSVAMAAQLPVQLGAFVKKSDAERALRELHNRPSMSNSKVEIVLAEVDGAIVHRLLASAPDGTDPDAFCRALKAEGLECFVRPR